MAAGVTTTGSLSDSQELIIDSGRIVREYEGVHMRTCDVVRLKDNTGLSWEEISLAQLTAQAVTETTELNNPQQIADTLFTITPTMVGIEVCVTDKVYRRMPKVVLAKMGQLAANAIARKRDEDYLTVFSGATTTLAGAGTTLTSGYINAAKSRITSNTTEPSVGTVSGVFHGFQIKDLADEIRSGVGTYAIPNGLTEDVFRKGFMGTIDGVNIFEDGNITIDGSDDARGAVHSKEAIVLVQGKSQWTETERKANYGGGADDMFIYDEYAYGERSSGNWLFAVLSDAAVPTS